jgi:hypothetical protein
MPARVANIAPCITQVTFKLVHYALLINQLRFGLTFSKVLANFPTDKYGLDCGLELNAKVFQLRLNNVSRVLALEGYDYSGHIISRQFSLFFLIFRRSVSARSLYSHVWTTLVTLSTPPLIPLSTRELLTSSHCRLRENWREMM